MSTLPPIYPWCVEHIRNVFEAKSEEDCRRAVAETFAHSIEFTTNGKRASYADLERAAVTMVMQSQYSLTVEWQSHVEVQSDYNSGEGPFAGYYIIHNVRRPRTEGKHSGRTFARHKFVNVMIESQSDPSIDSRRIVKLNLVWEDKATSGCQARL